MNEGCFLSDQSLRSIFSFFMEILSELWCSQLVAEYYINILPGRLNLYIEQFYKKNLFCNDFRVYIV